MVKKVYAVIYDDPTLFDEWFNTLPEAIYAVSFSGGVVYTALIPNQSWNFYDVGEKLKKVACFHSPYKWRIKDHVRTILLKEEC